MSKLTQQDVRAVISQVNDITNRYAAILRDLSNKLHARMADQDAIDAKEILDVVADSLISIGANTKQVVPGVPTPDSIANPEPPAREQRVETDGDQQDT